MLASYKKVPATSNVVITELSDEEVVEVSKPAIFPKSKRQKALIDVSQVRRSSRIAGLTAGFKSPAHAKAAETSSSSARKPATSRNIKKNLSSTFEAIIVQPNAPAPPNLPIETIQAIGVNVCQMPPGVVSEDALNYDSSHYTE